MKLRVALVLLLLAAPPGSPLRAQVPLGPEFLVNTYTGSLQSGGSVVSLGNGGFMVVWGSFGQDGDGIGVFARRYDSSGMPQGIEWQVNAYTSGNQESASAVSHVGANFVVVWQSEGQDGSYGGVFAQRYASSGEPQGSEFQVNSYTTGPQRLPSVAADAAGNLVVVWQSHLQDESGYGIFGQRFDGSGAPLGAEFHVSTTTFNDQYGPAVAADPAGNFIVAWTSYGQDGSGCGVFAQRYDPSGAARGSEFQVNAYTPSHQLEPSVASDGSGNFVVAWTSHEPEGDSWDIHAQRYDAFGVPQGIEFLANAYTTGLQARPSVSSDAAGNFAVVWKSLGQDGSAYGVFGHRYDTSGMPRGSEFRVNGYWTGDQTAPSVASIAPGKFVVAWQSDSQGDGWDVLGRRFADDAPPAPTADLWATKTDGLEVVAPGQLVTYTIQVTNSGPDPVTDVRVIDAFPSALTWLGWECTPSGGASCPTPPSGNTDIDALVALPVGDSVAFSATGLVVPGAFGTLANTASVALSDDYTDPDPTNNSATDVDTIQPPGIVVDDVSVVEGDSGTTLATFTAMLSRPIDGVVTVQFATADGTAVAPGDYQAWTGTLSFDPLQGIAQVSVEVVGDELDEGDETFHLILSDATNAVIEDGDGLGTIQDDENALLAAQALALTAPSQGVWAPGETVAVQPSWRNVGDGSTPDVTGLASVSGGGTAEDSAATYGVFVSGQTRSCSDAGDCYSVTATGPRPAVHWDIVLSETLSLGASHDWRLHVGDSFGDVSRGNVYFRFVEALLHHGVTGGCGVGTYCPASAVSREQVAVFALVAKEGPAYLPPACGPTPVFGDVPASSPFCRWIEELSRRGVVSGCGGGNYCPTDAVAREQMPIFMLRVADPAFDPPPCGTPIFSDVPASSPFCRWIEELARRGVVSGCGGGNYCPGDPVTREQMAVFVTATFGLALYGP